ncbi:MAG TPA: hypothetical protein VFT66_16290 [Roseiflexaceae bacterium]|jgi:hypothetical protein|nr:hypothetical protein [Roseiflexaceae bacterium]
MAEPITIEKPVQAPDVAPALLRAGVLLRARHRFAVHDRVVFACILLLALAQGILYLTLLPPWQHYDEPTHFEYAWLSANKTLLPKAGDENEPIRREIAASMLEHGFFRALPRPDLLTDNRLTWLGISELGHPPTYYAFTGLLLRAVNHLDVTSQLYVARCVSLVLFMVTIAVAWNVMRDILPAGHILRWAVPVAIVLLPPFADLMTSVNNDVAAVLVFSLVLWGAVRLLRFGITWQRVAWVCCAAGLALATKNTAAPAVPLALLAVGGALWMQRGWRWRWLLAGVAVVVVALIPATLTWGDAAYWYRWSWGKTQQDATQVVSSAAPLGAHVLLVEANADSPIRQLIEPLLPADVQRVSGTTITIGGWMWADRTAQVHMPTVVFGSDQGASNATAAPLITVTTTPIFVAQTMDIPANATLLQYTVLASTSGEPLRLFVDGAVIAEGVFPTTKPPAFDSAAAQSGTWAGQPFVNLVRNASAEAAWPHLRPWLEEAVFRYIHRSPSQTVAALFDVQRNGPLLITNSGLWVLFSFFSVYGWANVRLQGWAWPYLFQCIVAVGLLGSLTWLIRRRRALSVRRAATLAFLMLALLLIWGNTLLRPLPLLDPSFSVLPVARYGFPAIIPTMLALIGGWWALWPRRFRSLAVVMLLAGFALLDGVAVATIYTYFAA